MSITKNKKLTEELAEIKAKNMEIDGVKKIHDRQTQNLESEIESLKVRHRKEKEAIEAELEEKKLTIMRQAAEIKDLTTKKLSNQGKTEEFEEKIKSLIEEIESKSRQYLKDIAQIHEDYRGVQNTSAELEAKIQMYKADWDKATQAERAAQKEKLRLTF